MGNIKIVKKRLLFGPVSTQGTGSATHTTQKLQTRPLNSTNFPDLSTEFLAFPFVLGRRPFQFHEDFTFPRSWLYSLPFKIVLHIGIDVKRRVHNINVQNIRHIALGGALRVPFSWRGLPRRQEGWHEGRIRQSPQSFDIVSHSLQLELHIRKHHFLLIQIVLMFLDLFQVLLLLFLQSVLSLSAQSQTALAREASPGVPPCLSALTMSSLGGASEVNQPLHLAGLAVVCHSPWAARHQLVSMAACQVGLAASSLFLCPSPFSSKAEEEHLLLVPRTDSIMFAPASNDP